MSNTKFKCLPFLAMAFLGCTEIPDELRDEANGKCNGRAYTEYQFCANGLVYDFCGGLPYNPSIVDCCNNHQYTRETEFCSQSNIYRKCGGREYDPATQGCQNNVIQSRCGTSFYNSSTQFCNGNSVYSKCNGREYDPSDQRCQNDVVQSKCGTGSNYYDPLTQSCFIDNSSNNVYVYDLCNGQTYNPLDKKCENGVVVTKCGTGYYNPSTQFCRGNNVYDLCNGNQYNPFSPSERCENNVFEIKCGSEWYNPAAYVQYCKDGIVLTPYGSIADSRDGKIYRTVEIGTQTWMAENLNYNLSGSKCYGEGGSNAEIQANCAKYGRLYDWATAMIVCPNGWHLPGDADWETLVNFEGGSSLKATSGWDDYNGRSGNGTDDFGFSALPGGSVDSDGFFYGVGHLGNWWGATEEDANSAYALGMLYHSDGVFWSYIDKGFLFSVRCVKD